MQTKNSSILATMVLWLRKSIETGVNMAIDHTEILLLDDEHSLILAKPDGIMLLVSEVSQFIPKGDIRPDGEVAEDNQWIKIHEKGDDEKAEFEEWLASNSQALKARPRYQGVVFNHVTGMVEGEVTFPDDHVPYDAVTETVALAREIPKMLENALNTDPEGRGDEFGLFSDSEFRHDEESRRHLTEQFTVVKRDPPLTVDDYEKEYRQYGRDNGRTSDSAGEVLVLPRVMRAVRMEEQYRLHPESRPPEDRPPDEHGGGKNAPKLPSPPDSSGGISITSIRSNKGQRPDFP